MKDQQALGYLLPVRVSPLDPDLSLSLFRIVMPEIKIVKNPTEDFLKQIGVASWETWDCPVTEFRLDFDETEKAYILEGEIVVTPDGAASVTIVPGDYVEFPAGLKSMWRVTKQLKKHYSYD
ncbi:cupin domain-containing protein [Methylophaga lonarensis]|nr:cupin domain-containing protein [Methylophaga lonarensis]